HRVCIRLAVKTLDRDRCTGPKDPHGAYKKGAPLAVPTNAATTGKCFYVKTVCIQYCPDGARVCTAHCNYTPPGSAGAVVLSGQAAKPFGGPGDPTVGCRPRAQGGYAWYGWKPSVILEGKVGQQATRAQFSPYEWVGGGKVYYEGYSGHYSSGPVYYCENIAFAASSQYLCEQGSNTPVYTGNGFKGCRYHFGDCIQASLPQYPGTYVRGIMRDVSVNYDTPIIPSINALRALTIVNGIKKPETIVGWSPGTWWNSLDLNIRVVGGDPTCDDNHNPDDPPWKTYEWMDPVYQDIWHRIVDEPQLFAPAPRGAAGNVGSDRVAI
ncbi:MAG: hypothetical protein JWM86_220, partial [Thermoleophilia bacterium]|nr:hypothetical protein [Thermoleophilia bacterium]